MTTSHNQTRSIDDLHTEHQLWRTEAAFYKDELKVYQDRLSEIAAKNSKEEVNKQIEHFQNQFIIQQEQLHILKHDISHHEQQLSRFAKEYPTATDHKLFPDHEEMHAKVDTFKKLYAELQHEVNNFFAAWM